jgi:hypothetical protein
MLSGRIGTTLEGTLLEIAALALEEKLGSLAAAKTTVGTCIPAHVLVVSIFWYRRLYMAIRHVDA